MSGNRYEYEEWAFFLFEESDERDTILDRFDSLQTFSDKAHAAVERVCSQLDIDPPGVEGMHRATYLSVADYMGHGVGLWEVEDDEPWAAKLRPAILADTGFQAILEGVQ